MSAKDQLDKLELDWERHLAWRTGRSGFANSAAPGKYRDDTSRHGDTRVRLDELPTAVRDAFLKDFEAIVGAALDAKYQALHRTLRVQARAEAEETLRELDGVEP